jgi:NADPH:quinone reductase-like Zn-dependent oxidoreductase
MKAWRIERHGGLEVLERKDVPDPLPGPMQVLVRVEAVGLNHLDVWVRKGVEGHHFPLPLTPGCDIAGTIQGFGPGAEAVLSSSKLKLGSPILVNPGTSCGHCEACLGGFDPLCRTYGILGETQDGGCADLVAVSVANIIPRPEGLSATDGAALAIPYLTAWSMLTRKAQVRAGELVLIQAGGSGVSVAAIQMAKLLGAIVITTVGSDEKISKAQALGADYVIPYRKISFREEVKKITSSLGKKGCEVVLDHVGADTFQDSLKCLSWGGRFVTCGATSGAKVDIDLKAVFFKNLSILGSTMGSKSDLIRIVELVSLNKLKAVVDQIYPMHELPQAMERLEKRQAFGKIILTQSG